MLHGNQKRQACGHIRSLPGLPLRMTAGSTAHGARESPGMPADTAGPALDSSAAKNGSCKWPLDRVEYNFRDTWQFNVAAYKLDRLLDLRLVPVTIERR